MLQELSIKNFAIIDDLRIRFSDGLTILTGETGAGKSIIIQAVNLLLGGRADASTIRTGAESAELEAFFDIRPESATASRMEESGLDPSEGLLIRRILSGTDRHRIYINGRMSTLQTLAGITEHLAGISGQHAHQQLLREDRHLVFLDSFGGLNGLRRRIHHLYHQLTPLIRRRNELQELRRRQSEEKDLLRFQAAEIEEASIRPGEDSELEAQRLRLKNRELIARALHDGLYSLYQENGSVFDRLTSLRKQFDKISTLDSSLSTLHNKITEASFLVEDLAAEFRNQLEKLPLDNHRLEEIESRLDLLHRLKRKYGGSLETVLKHLESARQGLNLVENLESELQQRETEIQTLRQELVDGCLCLSEKRKKAATDLAQRISQELRELRMENVRFDIQLTGVPEEETEPDFRAEQRGIRETGWDKAAFQLSANPGEPPKPLASIASGGELSRVILALQVILTATESVETMIFDEVDAGIGGAVAEVVGKKLLQLSQTAQVICITHLPQIARFGRHHFSIIKQIQDNHTATSIRPLDESERIREIARMLGGETLTSTTLRHAREMLSPLPLPTDPPHAG